MYQKALMERQQDTHVSSACKIKTQELMKKDIQGYKEIKLKNHDTKMFCR